MNEEYSTLAKKVWQQLENEILQEWIYSEVKLSYGNWLVRAQAGDYFPRKEQDSKGSSE